MKTKKELENRIKNLEIDIKDLHTNRNNKKQNNSLSIEENENLLDDLSFLAHEIKVLEWVINTKPTLFNRL